MRLDRGIFNLNAKQVSDTICEFIRRKLTEMHREGILVSFSGGLDSSTVLLLCARAVGKDRVKALLMPEKQGNPEAEKYAYLVANRNGIDTLTRDISPILARLGTYNFVLSHLPTRKVQKFAVKSFFRLLKENPFLQIAQGNGDPLMRKGFARFNTKHRIRSAVAYLVAEELNYMVAGCAHQTEDMLGLFVKFGVDDNADIMPIKNLYRTQILQIAEYIGVPPEILQRTPNPDIIPGISDKYFDILGISSDILDLVLYGIDHGMEDGDIASQLALPEGKVKELRSLIEHTQHMRQPSQYPKIDGNLLSAKQEEL